MITTKRTNSSDKDFIALIMLLDADLAEKNGDDNDFFAQYNKVDKIDHVVLAYDKDEVVGCGAIKPYDKERMEVKRMFVKETYRGKGVASKVLNDLEDWAQSLSYTKCVLETGDKMLAAIGLYKKSNFMVIPNYGQYKEVASSICFEKTL
ncbi:MULTISPECIES: GNAT family N-acetyltransferase [Flammeovirga]|uniref:GNAT family N-acetyltransferase n=1 Tax=Flammeovirga agarivorans TaxID=2726742 RepID=A0A7X8SK97_9BACT|nr:MULTISPECIES: GNAT family N-acetyltransferase [Flammeovirga]NLR91720.1 GNAT family N-acetyltransferase [Flammeovirga agarivorans]